MVGIQLPLIPMEHHYLITENIAAIAALEKELPLVVDLDGEMYMRPEGKGLLVGVYESEATPWAVNGTSLGLRCSDETATSRPRAPHRGIGEGVQADPGPERRGNP